MGGSFGGQFSMMTTLVLVLPLAGIMLGVVISDQEFEKPKPSLEFMWFFWSVFGIVALLVIALVIGVNS